MTQWGEGGAHCPRLGAGDYVIQDSEEDEGISRRKEGRREEHGGRKERV